MTNLFFSMLGTSLSTNFCDNQSSTKMVSIETFSQEKFNCVSLMIDLFLFCRSDLVIKEIFQKTDISEQGPVSQSLLCKGPPLLKEGFFSFGKAISKFRFAKSPLTLLTKGLP